MFKVRMPLFSPDEAGGAEATAPVVETAAPIVEAPVIPQAPVTPLRNQPPKPLISYNPLLQDAPTPSPVVPVSPVVTPPVIEELDFAGRKVPVVDPVIRDIHKDYSNLQKTFQETNSTVKTLQEQNAMYENMVKMFQQQAPAPVPVAPAPEVPQEVSPEDTEAFMAKWYDNPKAAMQEAMQDFIKSQVDSKLQPIQQEREAIQREREATTEVQTLSSRYGDFQDHVPAMQELLKNNPQLAENGLETVYFVAKGQNQQAPVPTPTPEQLLNDPAFRSQLMGNEAFKNEMISNYLQNRTNANQQVPPVMGTQPGGNAPMMPENRPKTIREASKMWAKSLGF